jgi:hypothetical protein
MALVVTVDSHGRRRSMLAQRASTPSHTMPRRALADRYEHNHYAARPRMGIGARQLLPYTRCPACSGIMERISLCPLLTGYAAPLPPGPNKKFKLIAWEGCYCGHASHGITDDCLPVWRAQAGRRVMFPDSQGRTHWFWEPMPGEYLRRREIMAQFHEIYAQTAPDPEQPDPRDDRDDDILEDEFIDARFMACDAD